MTVFYRLAMVFAGLGLVAVLTACKTTPTPDSGEAMGCQSPLGFIAEGHSARGYLQPVAQGGTNCQQGELTCTDGQWSGAYIYPSCTLQ